MTTLRVIQDTFLKTQAKQSSELGVNQKREIKAGVTLNLEDYRLTQDKSHYLIELENGKRYFIFAKHCVIEGAVKLNIEESKILDFVPQIDALTCQAACIAQVIGSTNVAQVRRDLLKLGSPGDPYVMGEYLKPRVKEYKFLNNASLNDAREALKDGYHCITHGWFTGSGHVINLVGLRGNDFIADDPWYEFNFPAWTYSPWHCLGNDVVYSARGIYAACVAGHSVSQAIDIYNRGELDSTLKGMWLHIVEN